MTINQLQNFLIVAENLNFRKSAENILIAQPALSRQVQQLEEELGAKLFDRSKRQIELTAAGAYFRKEAERLLSQLEQVKLRTGEIHRGEVGTWRIGHASSTMQSILPELLLKLHAALPNVKIALNEVTNRQQFELLTHRELDFGFVPNALIPAQLASRLIYRENFVLFMSENHPLSKKANLTVADFADVDWITPPQQVGMGYVETIQRICQSFGFSPRIAYESPNAASALRLVEAGLGVTMMGKSTTNGIALAVKHIELVDIPQKVQMNLVWLREREAELKPMLTLLEKFLQPLNGN
jgi:LysR family transcriptional regulator, benzoate and cis,cis-muconate-responsive activator of ben and cat genes